MSNLSKYTGQEHDGFIDLLPGEEPGGVFTEQDRRSAYLVMHELDGSTKGDKTTLINAINIHDRLDTLANKYGSHSATSLLKRISAPAIVDLVELNGGIDKLLDDCAPRDNSGLFTGYDSQVGAYWKLQATV